ncbi:MAG: hypothetical protein PHC88_07345 [Terrimicrobiaceae bacterium]|nr:hypothetical protein [Terrimicrobiaceae bacterium]
MEATLRVLNELEREGVITRYAIGGAVGAIFYMEPFLTYDLDVFVVLPVTGGGLLTLGPVYEALRQRGYAEEGECVNIEGVPVQFLPAYNPLVEEALTEAVDMSYEVTPARVLRAEHLAAIMLQTGRDKDRQRFSTFLAEAEFDRAKLDSIVQRHQLETRWKLWTS